MLGLLGDQETLQLHRHLGPQDLLVLKELLDVQDLKARPELLANLDGEWSTFLDYPVHKERADQQELQVSTQRSHRRQETVLKGRQVLQESQEVPV